MDGFLSFGFLALSARTGAINAQAPPLCGLGKASGPRPVITELRVTRFGEDRRIYLSERFPG